MHLGVTSLDLKVLIATLLRHLDLDMRYVEKPGSL